ncbi:MAG: dTDP-4-dehydrorhamnose 3,5-epimerase family protein [Sphingomonadales bacterium]
MRFTPTNIRDVVVIEPQTFSDDRGLFKEIWHQEKFRKAGIDVEFVQENYSRSKPGVLRGLHYQLNRPQGKLVHVIQGAVYDIAVDLRMPAGGRSDMGGVLAMARKRSR